MANIDFAALLCSRLCHDLVSPVGAINNGLAILQEEQDASMKEAVLDLIEKSTRQTSNKLQFFRLAFGAAGGFSAQLDVRECEKAMRAFLDGSRAELEWDVHLTSGSKSFVKVLLNVGLVVAEALIRGGKIVIKAYRDGDAVHLSARAEGQRVILQQSVKAALLGELSEDELDPRAAPAFLARTVALEHGGSLEIEELTDATLCVNATIDFTPQSSNE